MTIAPGDAAVAARSFARRWRALFATATSDEDTDLLARSGALEMADQAAHLLAATADRLPVGAPRGPTVIDDDVLARLDAGATRLADAVEAVPADDWAGAPIETLSAAIDQAAALLRQAERAIDEARRRH